jgi:GTP cyclohydrolase I
MATEPTNAEDSKYQVSWGEISSRLHARLKPYTNSGEKPCVYGVPKNGMILTAFLPDGFRAVGLPGCADIILDDLIDSGRTSVKWAKQYPGKPFVVLFDKRTEDLGWLVFPWEDEEADREDLVVRQLEVIGEDPTREGLLDTPARVVKAWDFMYGGYNADLSPYEKAVFMEPNTDEMIILKNIEFYSTCEHHMLPFFGKAHVGYIPIKGKVIGVSKMARVVDAYSRRLQIQERLTAQVAVWLKKHLKPKGVAVVMEAQHLCMMARGVQKQNSVMTTSAMYDSFRQDMSAREEFLNRIS